MARSLFDLVASAAERADPARPAVVSSGGRLAYGELVEGARGIAATLAEARVGRGDRVGIWMEKTPECVQSILGVMAAGAAYVPLDPRAPWRRCRTIALDCGIKGLITDGPRAVHLADLSEGLPLSVVLTESLSGPTGMAPRVPSSAVPTVAGTETIAGPTGAALPSSAPVLTLREATRHAHRRLDAPAGDELAYILYTSGSTGTPKGVVHTHASGLAFTEWVQKRFAVASSDVFSSHAPFHFDLSISDLYASLGSGATVRLISSSEGMLPPYLVRMIGEWGITVWYSVPSILVAMLEMGGLDEPGTPPPWPALRTLLFAGEVFPTPQLRRLRRRIPGVGLYNLFGPTETNVCTYYEVPPVMEGDGTAPIPIGRACEHMEVFVLDDAGREVTPGVEGTLWAKGGNLMQGYWGDAERTASVLRRDPRGGAGMAYCTGDRVRLRPDGEYEFLGRRDHMVKTRGYRVELGEIEAALSGHPAVREAVATPVPDPAIGNRLVATVVLRAGATAEGEELRSFCRQRLPAYMVPESIDLVPDLPRTSTGKADRSALALIWKERTTS